MSAENQPLVRYEKSNQIVVGTIDAATALDSDGAKIFGDAVIQYLKQHPGTRLLLNFQDITYLSSAALSELLRINEAALEAEGGLRLCGLSKEIHKVFEITQLGEVFHVNPDEDVDRTIMRLDHDAQWDVYRA